MGAVRAESAVEGCVEVQFKGAIMCSNRQYVWRILEYGVQYNMYGGRVFCVILCIFYFYFFVRVRRLFCSCYSWDLRLGFSTSCGETNGGGDEMDEWDE